MPRSLLRSRYHREVSIVAIDLQYPFVQPQFKRIVLRCLSVVFQRLDASRLFCRADQRKIANFEQFRRGEKHHVHGVMEDRIAKAGLVDDNGRIPARLASMAVAKPVGPAPMQIMS